MYNLVVLFSFIFAMVSCEKSRFIHDFIEKYDTEDFNKFSGFSVYLRGLDDKGDLLFFANLDNDSCEAPVIVKVSKTTKIVQSTDVSLVKMHCKKLGIDTVVIKNLVQEFMEYDITYLEVKKDSMVLVSNKLMDRPRLVRMPGSGINSMPDNFEHVKGRWFVRQ